MRNLLFNGSKQGKTTFRATAAAAVGCYHLTSDTHSPCLKSRDGNPPRTTATRNVLSPHPKRALVRVHHVLSKSRADHLDPRRTMALALTESLRLQTVDVLANIRTRRIVVGFLSRNPATLVSNSWRLAKNQQTTRLRLQGDGDFIRRAAGWPRDVPSSVPPRPGPCLGASAGDARRTHAMS